MSGTPHQTPAAALFRDVRREAGRKLWITGALMAAGALAEGASLLILLPMLSLVSGEGGRGARFAADVIPGMNRLPFVLGLFLLLMIARSAILFVRDRASARLESDYERSLRLRAAITLADRGWPFAASVGQAGMQALLDNDVPRSSTAVHFGLSAATAVFLLLIQLAVAATLSWPMALGALVLLSLGLPSMLKLARRSELSGLGITASQQVSVRAAFSLYAGLKAALAQGSAGRFIDAYDRSLVKLADQMVDFATALANSRARHAIAAAAAAATIIAVGSALALDLPRLLVLLVLFARMSGPAQSLQQALASLAANAPAFANIEALLGELSLVAPLVPTASPLDWTVVEGLGLALDRGGGAGLAPVDFTLRRGEWLALSGTSGAGKTSLVDIIAGLIAPTAGQLLVDGAPLDATRLAGWRAGLSYIGQQEAPFDETIRGALGSATDAELWAALGLVGLADVVRGSPSGLDTRLAERGDRLSGGERQRLLIARALMRQPRLLLLDEATAALDVVSERALVERLRAARPKMAVLLVAHRAESLALCDRALAIGGHAA